MPIYIYNGLISEMTLHTRIMSIATICLSYVVFLVLLYRFHPRRACCGCLLQGYLGHIGHLDHQSPVQATSSIEYHLILTVRGKATPDHGVFCSEPSSL